MRCVLVRHEQAFDLRIVVVLDPGVSSLRDSTARLLSNRPSA
jgi:hypothetical protein